MTDYKRIATSAEVWAVLKARHHKDLGVYASYSDPDGTASDFTTGRMETSYALKGADYPLMEARTTWRIDPQLPHARLDEIHEYWLCIPLKDAS